MKTTTKYRIILSVLFFVFIALAIHCFVMCACYKTDCYDARMFAAWGSVLGLLTIVSGIGVAAVGDYYKDSMSDRQPPASPRPPAPSGQGGEGGPAMIYRIWRRLLTWFGDIYCATRPPKVKAEHIRELMRWARPGDVICRKYTYYLDSYFIPGEYSHSGIIVDDQQMVHAVAEGVERIDVIDFVKDCDGFVLLRPRYNHSLGEYEACYFAEGQCGKGYDFLFDSRDKSKFYCHELTAAALTAGGVSIDKYAFSNSGVILASDIIAACDVVYEMKGK